MTTTPPPTAPGTEAPEPSRGRGLAARVSLGRTRTPLSLEYVLIASVALFLTVFGFVMVLSATSASKDPFDVASKQGLFALIGIPLMFIIGRFPTRFWKRMSWVFLILAIAFQLLIYSPLKVTADGNTSWVNIFGIQAQPAEFLKLATVIWIGAILSRKQALLGQWRHLIIPLVPMVIIVLVSVLGGEDLGTAMILMLVIFAALFFAGIRLRVFILPLLVGLSAVAFFAFSSANRRRRITSFLDPLCNANDQLCYQQQHGLWGLANGGVFGVGLGNSVEKYGWLPARGNDFIFAIVGEELGLIGCLVVLAMFAILTYAGMRMVRRADDLFVRIVAGGIVVWIVGQALVNIAVVLRLAPPLGVPLPFLSQGGTSLVSVLLASGVLLSLARSLPPEDRTAKKTDAARPRTPVQRID